MTPSPSAPTACPWTAAIPEDGVRILRVVAGGEGLARLPDGRTLFVPRSVPGDVVDPGPLEDKGRWARAPAATLLTPSPEREEPACPVSHRCGGCDWMGWQVTAQRKGKADIVVDALRRTGGVELDVPPTVVGGATLGWRRRLRLAVDGSVVGMRARGSREIVPLRACPVADPRVEQALAQVSTLALEQPMAGIEGIELRALDGGPEVVGRVFLEPHGDAAARESIEALSALFPVVVDAPAGRGRWEARSDEGPDQALSLPGASLRAPARAFTQVHAEVNRALVQAVVDAVGEPTGRVVDACCGAGNFALPLLAVGHDVLGVDVAAAAVAAARRAAEEQGLGGTFRIQSSRRALESLAPGSAEVVVLDPPRRGARDLVPGLLRLAPLRIVYVACDPVALARDVKSLARDYRLESVRCFDLFPQTHHVETLAVLERRA